ncbi:universal stress protein UspA [Cupriavidus sp. SK-3]|uniref:universal stress protein n=1 Tax=Cupriavidus sp. SK-3 TaxID=1470558 RepID=UPI0004535F84|nr:universal stress protein [Cupriavidus sp. SK-3]KDP87461.1 universal stress protein UspA [Cupriavidus sp. SK-3]
MQNIVLATDGSTYSDAAAQCLADRRLFKDGFSVHVVHCLPDLSGEVKSFISKKDIDAWHTEESAKVMQSVAAILRGAGVPFEEHSLVGFAPERIVDYAKSIKAEAIIMGAHGRGAFLEAIVGSVAGRVIAHAECPVVLVKVPSKTE